MGDQTTPIGTAVGARALVARAFASLDEAWTAALAHEPDAEVRVAFDRALESVQAFLRGDLSDAEAPALEDLTALALERLETDARAFMTQSDLEAAETARLGALLSARALALRRIVRRCARLAQRDEVPYLLGEIQDIERDLVGPSRRTTATGKGGGTKDPEARRAFAEIVMARANATLAAARAHRPAADNLVETFRAYRSVEAAHTLLLHIEGDGDPALFETVDAVRGASAGLEDGLRYR